MTKKNIWKNPSLYLGGGLGIAAVVGLSLIPGILPIAVGAAGVVGVMAGALGTDFGALRQKVALEEPEVVNVYLPELLIAQIEKLQRIVSLYKKSDEIPALLLKNMESILHYSNELFTRVSQKYDTQSAKIVSVNYTDILTKLNKALSSDYYLDIKKNPNLWDNAPERLAAVERATEATEKQLIMNIRQVNASQDIDYEVSLESLTSSMDGFQAKEMLSDS